MQPPLSPSVAPQWAEIEALLTSEEGLGLAAAVLRSRSVFGLPPEELVADAWMRLGVTFGNRDEAYPIWSERAPARLVARAMDAALVDRLRRRRPLAGTVTDLPGGLEPHERYAHLDAMRSVLAEINRIAPAVPVCVGCRHETVVATALAVVHRIALGPAPEGRGSDFDRLLSAALVEVLGDLEPAALRQRRRRCGPCVRTLISEAMGSVGLGEP